MHKNSPPSERISTHFVKVHLHSSGGNLWKDALECMCCSELWKVCGINKWKQVRFMYGAYILHCEHFLYIEWYQCCLGFPFFKSGSYFSNIFKITDYVFDYLYTKLGEFKIRYFFKDILRSNVSYQSFHQFSIKKCTLAIVLN